MAYYTLPSTTLGTSLGRETTLIAPNAYDPNKTGGYPLLLILHSYGASGADIVPRFALDEGHNFDDGMFIIAPDGQNDGVTSNKWWDYRTPGNAAFAYPKLLVDEAIEDWNIDEERVYVAGYSNGAFMAHELVRYYEDRFTAIWTLAGSRLTGATTPATHIAATIIHGDGDTTVLTAGDVNGATLPGTMGGTSYKSHAATVADYITRNGGVGALGANYGSLNLVTAVGGDETTREPDSDLSTADTVEKWTIVGGDHSFSFTAGRGQTMYVQLETKHRGV